MLIVILHNIDTHRIPDMKLVVLSFVFFGDFFFTAVNFRTRNESARQFKTVHSWGKTKGTTGTRATEDTNTDMQPTHTTGDRDTTQQSSFVTSLVG